MADTIEVMFTCRTCGLDKVKVNVPARRSPDSDVRHYVEQVVGRYVQWRHNLLKPGCGSKVDVYIPLDKDDPEAWIGKPKQSGGMNGGSG